MNNKTLSIISYITIIGWLVAYFVGKDNADSLLKYHLKQSFALFIVTLVFSVALNIIANIFPFLGFLSIISLAIWILAILGIINAINENEKPIPVIGKWAENQFSFLN